MIRRICGLALFVCVAVAAVALVSATASPSHAASINWGDYVGTSVTYSTVKETSNDALPLFGRPTVLGPAPPGITPCSPCSIPADSLDFTPTFNAFSNASNGNAGDITDGQLNFTVTAHPGQ